MALEPIPSDPRTWTDFRDPAARGFLKVDCDTAVEGLLSGGALAVVVVAGLWAWALSVTPAQPGAVPLPLAAIDWRGPVLLGAGAAMLFGLRLLTDNFYLVDPERHIVYFHSQFGFFRRVRLLVEPRDVVAISVQTRWRLAMTNDWEWDLPQSRTWWDHRIALIDTRGRILPFSDWRADGLWPSNNDAAELAKKLGCRWFQTPEQSALAVTRQGGDIVAKFRPATWFTQPDGSSWVTMVTAFVLTAAAACVRLVVLSGRAADRG